MTVKLKELRCPRYPWRLLDIELQPDKPPILRAEAAGDAPAGPWAPGRVARRGGGAARFWSVASGCVTRQTTAVPDGWPPPS